MDSIRRFIANFKKHGSISCTSSKRVEVLKNIENNAIKEAEGKLFEDIKKLNNASTIEQDATENSKNLDTTSQVQSTNAKQKCPVDTKSNCSDIANTTECLEEFNEILQEIDINTESSVTLDEIDDVINEMTEGNDTLCFTTPRFDLHELVEDFGCIFEQNYELTDIRTDSDENIETIDIHDFISPDNLDGDLDEDFDADEFEKNMITKKNSKGFIEINMELPDIISISSEDSQVIELMDNVEVLEPLNIKLNTLNEPRNVDNANTDLPSQDEVPIEDFTIHSTQNNIDKKANCEDDKLNFNPKDVKERDFQSNTHKRGVFDENEMEVKIEDPLPKDILNFYSSKDKEESTELNSYPDITVKQHLYEELKESKYQETLFAYDFNRNHKCNKLDEIINIEAKETINKIVEDDKYYVNNSQDIISINDSEIDTESVYDENEIPNTKSNKTFDSNCGYLSSDFEFITEEEAKLDGLIVNFNPTLTKKITKPNKVKTIEISVDRYSNTFCSSESSPETIQDDPNISVSHQFELQSRNIEPNDPNNSELAQNCVTQDIYKNIEEHLPTGLRGFRRNLDTHRYHISNCQNSMQNIRPTNGQELNDLERNNPGPSIKDHERSDFVGNRLRPNILRGNRLEPRNSLNTSENDIQRWRAIQKRRRMYLEQSYRDHLILSNDDYYQLFNPNYLPLPNPSMRLENKSTLSVSTMLIEYDGVGFDMQMMRGNSESEEEEVKEQATACAQKILQMYPRENRKRRRRF